MGSSLTMRISLRISNLNLEHRIDLVSHGPWPMVHGPWTMVRYPLTVSSGTLEFILVLVISVFIKYMRRASHIIVHIHSFKFGISKWMFKKRIMRLMQLFILRDSHLQSSKHLNSYWRTGSTRDLADLATLWEILAIE